MNRHLMETQNLVISFDYSYFLAKNLAYAECPIMKFHYWNSSNIDLVLFYQPCSLITFILFLENELVYSFVKCISILVEAVHVFVSTFTCFMSASTG